MLCQKILENDKTTNFCYDCNKIICLYCIGNHSHKNISKYEYLPKKCVIHISNITHYCKFCKKDLCKKCIGDDLEHFRKGFIINSPQKNIIIEIEKEQIDNIVST